MFTNTYIIWWYTYIIFIKGLEPWYSNLLHVEKLDFLNNKSHILGNHPAD